MLNPFLAKPLDLHADLTGKVVIVTGGTGGIGKAAAYQLSEWNAARVIIGCRNEQKGNAVVAEIKNGTGRGNIEAWPLELADLESVRAFAKRFKECGAGRLDLLLNNAGLVKNTFKKTKDGFEIMFQVNFLSHFLLTNLLLDELKATPGARVVHTSSGMANSAGKIDLGNLNGEKGFSTARFYGNSKLLQIIYSNELNRRLETTGVISNAIHPGFIGSGIGSDVNPLLRPLRSFIMLFSSPPKDGALSVLYGAVANDVGSETMRGGRFFFNGNEKKMPPQAEDVVLAKKIWDLAEKLTSESKQDGNQ